MNDDQLFALPNAQSYIDMTTSLMAKFGVTVERVGELTYRVPRRPYTNPPAVQVLLLWWLPLLLLLHCACLSCEERVHVPAELLLWRPRGRWSATRRLPRTLLRSARSPAAK